MKLKEMYWKPGNILVSGNKDVYIIVNDNICISPVGYMTKDSYNDEFACSDTFGIDWDHSIMEIYQVGKSPGLGLNTIFDCIIKGGTAHCDGFQYQKLWSRSVTLKVDEVREKFGYPEGTEIYFIR